jgi:hypothetical protein
MIGRRLPLRVLLGAVAGHAAVGLWLPATTLSVFSGDIGLKLVQADNLARGHAWLDYPGHSLDPAHRLFPFGPPFTFSDGGRIYSVYLNPITYLASVAYRVAGVWGCHVIPLAGTAGLLLGTLRLARRLGEAHSRAVAAALLLLLATPVWFYGWVFWEHAPAAALCLAATLVLSRTPGRATRRQLLAAGALLGVAGACRPEALLYLGATAVALWAARRRPISGATLAGVAAAVLVALALLLPGPPLAHVAQNLAPMRDAPGGFAALAWYRLDVLTSLIGGVLRPAPSQPPRFVAAAAATTAAVVLLGLSLRPSLKDSRAMTIALCAAGAVALVPSLFAWADRQTLLTGLLPACPLTVLALSRGASPLRGPLRRPDTPAEPIERSSTRSFIGRTASGFAASVLLLAPNDGGNQWGPRYLLPALPLLVCLLLTDRTPAGPIGGPAEPRVRRWAGVLLLVASVAVQVVGARNHLRMHREKTEAWSRLADLPGRYVVTHLWFVPQEAAPLSLRGDKVFLLAGSEDALRYAVERMERAGVTAFAFVGAPRSEPPPRRWGRYAERTAFPFALHPFRLQASSFVRGE